MKQDRIAHDGKRDVSGFLQARLCNCWNMDRVKNQKQENLTEYQTELDDSKYQLVSMIMRGSQQVTDFGH